MYAPTILVLLFATISLSAPSKELSKASAGSASSNSTSAGCDAAAKALAAGIQSNIDDQHNELATVTALGSVLAQNPIDTTLYAATQSSLLGFVTKGITIRQNNQKIAPAGNAAIPGLAIVATAQATELNLTMSLAIPSTGKIDVAAANQTVEALKGDFSGGIVQNQKNLVAAVSGCNGTKATA